MNLDLVNMLFNNVKNKDIQSFLTELQKHMENTKKEENSMLESSYNGNKITERF